MCRVERGHGALNGASEADDQEDGGGLEAGIWI
jgi:hypothetical protein